MHTKRQSKLAGLSVLSVLLICSCASTDKLADKQILPLPERFHDSTSREQPVSLSTVFFSDPKLKALIEMAIQNNQDVKAGIQRVVAARTRSYIARANNMPSVDLIASGSADKYGEYTLNGIGNFDTNLSPNIDDDHKIPVSPTTEIFLGLRTEWEIDVWGKLKDRRKAQYQRFLSSQMAQQWLITQLASDVARLYYELQEADAQLAVLEQNKKLQADALEMVKAQVEAGRSTALATHQFEAMMKRTQTDIHLKKQQQAVAEAELNLLLGRYPVPISRTATAAVPPLLYPQPGLPADVLLRRPDIKEAELELLATKADVSAARKAMLPSLRLNGYTAFNSFSANQVFLPGSIAYGLLGGLTAPVFNKRELKGSKAIAEAAREQAFYNYQKKVLQGYKEVYVAINDIGQFQKAYDSKQAEVARLDTAASVALELYTSGYANYLEVIDARRNVLNASLEAATLRKQVFISTIDLYRSAGGG